MHGETEDVQKQKRDREQVRKQEMETYCQAHSPMNGEGRSRERPKWALETTREEGRKRERGGEREREREKGTRK